MRTCVVTDASNKRECVQNMKCLNYECIQSAMLLLLNYLHEANKMNIERRKEYMLLQMKNSILFNSILNHTLAASGNFCISIKIFSSGLSGSNRHTSLVKKFSRR